MPEIDLRQLWFTYSACVRFTKNKEWIQKFNKIEDSSLLKPTKQSLFST